MSPLAQVGVAAGIYAAVVLVIGIAATRRAAKSPDEYFLAGRALGTVVLFMALFGTNATSFVLVGVPGRAYTDGVGVFGINAPIIALGIPLTFWLIGSPAWAMARRLSALTPAELYARRFGSRGVGALLFAAFTLYTLPYMVQAVVGVSVALHQHSDGAVAPWLGGLGVVLVSLVYTSLGGMRATAWTNVFQGAVFLGFMVAAFFFISSSLGGLAAATEAVRAHDPGLLSISREGLYAPRAWASWGMVISLTVIAFPHMLARLMAAKNQASLRTVSRMYPFALALLWVPAVFIGVWGAAAFPGLDRPDTIFPLMTQHHLPAILAPLGVLAVLAAVMSTLDAQLLTLSSMLVRDVLDAVRPARSPRADVLAGRLFVMALAALVWTLAQVWNDESVFDISRKAFEGYTTLVPALFLGVRWKRFNATGAVASIAAGTGVLALGWAERLPTAGFLPVFWAVVAALVVGVVAALVTAPPDERLVRAAFGGDDVGGDVGPADR